MRKFALLLLVLVSVCGIAKELDENPYTYADEVGDFSDGLLAIKMGARWALDSNSSRSQEVGKWGFVDKTGKFVIRPKYDAVSFSGFSNGLIGVKIGDKWGAADSVGQLVMQPAYTWLGVFHSGVTIATIKKTDKTTTTYTSTLVASNGATISAPNCSRVQYLNEDKYSCQISNLYALMSHDGKLLTKPIYNEIREFQNGYAPIVVSSLANGRKTGVIDSNGTVRIEPLYEWIGPYKNEPMQIKIDQKYGYITLDGKVIVEPKYKSATPFQNGLAAVETNTTWEYIDSSGKMITNEQFVTADQLYQGVGRVSKKNFLGQKRYGYIDSSGKYIVEPTKYSEGGNFSDGLASVCRLSFMGGKTCGYINDKGEEVLPLKYAYANSFSAGIAKVGERVDLNNAISMYIDKSGKEIFRGDKPINIRFFGVLFPDIYMESFDKDGYASLRQNGLYGIINKDGKVVIEPQYKSIGLFHNGIAKVTKAGGGVVFIDINGSVVLPK